MTKPIARDPIYRRRVFDADVIELCVRWYVTYRLSYRDLVVDGCQNARDFGWRRGF
jgi:transposase-like protein